MQYFGMEITEITYNRATILAFTQPLIALYQCIRFHLIPFNSLRDMLRPSLLSQQEHRKRGNIFPNLGIKYMNSLKPC